jgi:hypothetical protein
MKYAAKIDIKELQDIVEEMKALSDSLPNLSQDALYTALLELYGYTGTLGGKVFRDVLILHKG